MKKDFAILFLIFAIVGSILTATINKLYHEQEETILSDDITQIQLSYEAVTNMYGILLKVIVDEQVLTPKVLDIMEKATTANSEEKKVLRGRLYRNLWKLYESELSPLNMNLFQFHLPNGESFLRFHNITSSGDNLLKVRKSIRDTNINHKYSSGFEGGLSAPGFRHVYPITVNGKHIGSVEVSLAFEALRRELSKLIPTMELNFIMKHFITTDIVFKKQLSGFSSVFFSENYIKQNPNVSELEKDSKSDYKFSEDIKEYILEHKEVREEIANSLKKTKPFSISITEKRTYSIHFIPIFDTNNKLAAYIVGYDVHPDIDILKKNKNNTLVLLFIILIFLISFSLLLLRNRKQIIQQKNEIETIAHTVSSGLLVLNSQGVLTFINEKACDMLGYKSSELLGRDIHKKVHHHADPSLGCKIKQVSQTGKSYIGEEEFIKKNGIIFPVSVSTSAFKDNDHIIGSVTIFRDITDEKSANEKMKQMAFYDSLTELPNRKFFLSQVKRIMDKNRKNSLYSGIIYIDLDDFKQVNDTYGHAMGDSLLMQIAKRITAQIRTQDMMGRLGGDEFAIIIDAMNKNINETKDIFNFIVEKIHESFKKPFNLGGREYYCSVSMGGIIFKSDHLSTDKIMAKADDTMYQAKKSGKNTYKIRVLN